jgi:hypothetical protein
MKVFGRSKVSEFLGDFVVYRNLVPCDTRLPSLGDIHQRVDLPPGQIPRKIDPNYARVIVHLLQAARKLDEPGHKIERLIFVGDTRLNDSTAFNNLCQAGRLPGLAFICSEKDAPLETEILSMPAGGELFLANRWSALSEFNRYCSKQDFPIDASTAVVVDLDKTAIGARGRNAQVIDQARIQAVENTVADFLGNAFDQADFRKAYELLNQQKFHPFTLDNQDYLAYICLILGGGVYDLDDVVEQVGGGHLKSFDQFITQINNQRDDLPAELATIHDEIYSAVRAGDPTPFKAFRRNEYLVTVGLMGKMGDARPVDVLLHNEIVITQEVRAQALEWKKRGALLLGLSDKPDEASIPSPEQETQGFHPIHRTETHVVGS